MKSLRGGLKLKLPSDRKHLGMRFREYSLNVCRCSSLVFLVLLMTFVCDHRSAHSEVTEYPVRKWANRQTGAVEFTATITSGDLAFLNWRPTHSADSASVSVDLHASLNHMPFSSVRTHTKPAARAERPRFRVFYDVHGPLAVRSMPAVYFFSPMFSTTSHGLRT